MDERMQRMVVIWWMQTVMYIRLFKPLLILYIIRNRYHLEHQPNMHL